jgi:DNA invertase Pin-like site-specific DNA recombinase
MSRSDQIQSPAKDFKKTTILPLSSIKIKNHHLDRWAVVYVRQSTHHQIIDHPESTARQYALADRAVALGWYRERVEVIDQDLGITGQTTEAREGFKRLEEMVMLKHVGIVLGLEVSRMARCNRDWHNLFEECANRDTLLSDEDGVYDANDLNDRLVLGMKGIMSEMETHIMKNRLERGRWNKAERGELYEIVPRGYVRLPGGGADKDPDEEVREVVSLVFQTFKETGTIYSLLRRLVHQGIRIPKRLPPSGTLQWNPPTYSSLQDMIHHPMYGGAYSFGKQPNIPYTTPHKRWKILILNHLPAYVTWAQYVNNQRTMAQNQTTSNTRGPSRQGSALLTGLVFCGQCDRRLGVSYGPANRGYYNCPRRPLTKDDKACGGLAIRVIDQLVANHVLRALEPASLELSLHVLNNVQAERTRQERLFLKRTKRAAYDCQQAERRYLAADPENRLVTRTLERRWQETLVRERDLLEEHDRFLKTTPLSLTEAEQTRINKISRDIPTLWNSPDTSPKDKKDIIRCLVEKVIVNTQNYSDRVDVTIHWIGGFVSQTELKRPVRSYTQLANLDALLTYAAKLRRTGCCSSEIARQLNAKGFRTAEQQLFKAPTINTLFHPNGIAYHLVNGRKPGPDQWTVTKLAQHLGITSRKLKYWVKFGWIQLIQKPCGGQWIVWADAEELCRLRWLAQKSHKGMRNYPPKMLTPKSMPREYRDNEIDIR